jgi:DNA-binding transcriptional regulator YdaS (Cro superfamily)
MENLKKFWLSLPVPERSVFAARCGTTERHLRNVAYGKTCGEDLAINIDRESRGAVTCEELRPDVDFAYLRGTAKPHHKKAA